MAYVASACKSWRGALVSDDAKSMVGMTTIAHEVLHTIGAVHDGTVGPDYVPGSPSAENCPDEKQFIMTATPPHLLLPLSNCTRDQVLAFLETPGAACLQNSQQRTSPSLSEANLRTILVDANRYCKHLHKDAETVQYVASYNEAYDIRKCILVCLTVNVVGEKEHNIHAAPDYTPCSDTAKQVCYKGICMDIPHTPKSLPKGIRKVASARLRLLNEVHRE
nr:A disintegrin and metalloproteinase with thrombospondin motifs 18-like [Dermacentor andersoni]